MCGSHVCHITQAELANSVVLQTCIQQTQVTSHPAMRVQLGEFSIRRLLVHVYQLSDLVLHNCVR